MAHTSLQKIRITGLKSHYKILMQSIQQSGSIEIIENSLLISASQKTYEDYYNSIDLSRIEFAIGFLSPFTSKHSKLDQLLSGGKLVLEETEAKSRLKKFVPQAPEIVESCQRLETEMVKLQNEIKAIPEKKVLAEVLIDFNASVQSTYQTKQTSTFIGKLSHDRAFDFEMQISKNFHLIDFQRLGQVKNQDYFRITVINEKKEEMEKLIQSFDFQLLDLNLEFGIFEGEKFNEIGHKLDRMKKEYEEDLEAVLLEIKSLTPHLEDLKIMAEYNTWKKLKNDYQQKMYVSPKIFAFEGWIMASQFESLNLWIKKAFVGEVIMETLSVEEEETPPVLLKNYKGVNAFEPITQMYGLPQVREFDPTPFLAPFFLIFFGLCLSDVGYGLILLLVSSFFLLFGKFSVSAKNSLALIFYCGLATIFGGILLGGYFGMTAEQFSYWVNPQTGNFYGQIITPAQGSGPIVFLQLALALGVLHILFGMGLDFVQRLRNKDYESAFLDTGVWIFMLFSLGIFAFGTNIGLSAGWSQAFPLIGMGLLVLTQGRHQKNWFMKLVFGVLGIYNITNYLSDILSYSRIMALGLATGVVGFAMNLTGDIFGSMMPHPILGLGVAIFVIILGHLLNFSLSLLGAFIHSGRLQFIEFFGKFYQGGGRIFKPFARTSRYLFLK